MAIASFTLPPTARLAIINHLLCVRPFASNLNGSSLPALLGKGELDLVVEAWGRSQGAKIISVVATIYKDRTISAVEEMRLAKEERK